MNDMLILENIIMSSNQMNVFDHHSQNGLVLENEKNENSSATLITTKCKKQPSTTIEDFSYHQNGFNHTISNENPNCKPNLLNDCGGNENVKDKNNQDDRDPISKLFEESESSSLNYETVMNNNINHEDNHLSSLSNLENHDDSFDDFQTHLNLEDQQQEHFNPANQANQQNDNKENEEFADFASFNSKVNFANFTNYGRNSTTTIQYGIETKVNEDYNKDDDDFEDFADFTSNIVEVQKQSFSSLVPARTTINLHDHKSLIQETFPLESKPESYQNTSNDQKTINTAFFDPEICSINAKELWDSLQQLDLKLNFSFDKWKQSSSFRHLLEALKIDPRNVIPPHLFSSLSLMNPISHHYNQILQPTIYDYSTTKMLSSETQIEITPEESRKLSLDILSIRNVQTTSSPNNNNQSTVWPQNSQSEKQQHSSSVFNNLAQDLDFFETKYANITNKITSDTTSKIKNDLISEFDEFFMIDDNDSDAMENVDKANENKPSSEPWESLQKIDTFHQMFKNSKTIAAKNTNDSRAMKCIGSNLSSNQNNEQVLSAEALQILTELPNLSMMRAKVLMFPIKHLHEGFGPLNSNTRKLSSNEKVDR